LRPRNLWGISFFPSLISLTNFAFSSSGIMEGKHCIATSHSKLNCLWCKSCPLYMYCPIAPHKMEVDRCLASPAWIVIDWMVEDGDHWWRSLPVDLEKKQEGAWECLTGFFLWLCDNQSPGVWCINEEPD